MISDSTLIKISLVVSAVGIMMLFVLSELMQPKYIPIQNITESLYGERIMFNGSISSLTLKNGNLYARISNGENYIKIVMFKTFPNLTAGQGITVIGRVSIFDGDTEVIAESIKGF